MILLFSLRQHTTLCFRIKARPSSSGFVLQDVHNRPQLRLRLPSGQWQRLPRRMSYSGTVILWYTSNKLYLETSCCELTDSCHHQRRRASVHMCNGIGGSYLQPVDSLTRTCSGATPSSSESSVGSFFILSAYHVLSPKGLMICSCPLVEIALVQQPLLLCQSQA